jgi:hypothetical protein
MVNRCFDLPRTLSARLEEYRRKALWLCAFADPIGSRPNPRSPHYAPCKACPLGQPVTSWAPAGIQNCTIPYAIKSEPVAKTATDAQKGAVQPLECAESSSSLRWMLQPSTYACSIGGDADEPSGLAFAKPKAVQDTCETWRTH